MTNIIVIADYLTREEIIARMTRFHAKRDWPRHNDYWVIWQELIEVEAAMRHH